MARGRDSKGRFLKARRAGRTLRSMGRKGRVALRGFATRARGFGHRLSSGLPAWAKPSRIVAYTGLGVGVLQLLFSPLPNGDSWMGRLMTGISNFRASQNPEDLLATDPDGNNVITIATIQLAQNAPKAVWTLISYSIPAAVLKYFGM